MKNDYKIEKLHPKIWVFKNAYKSSAQIINYYETNYSDKWHQWENFGTEITLPIFSENYKNFPTEEEWQKNHIDKYRELSTVDEIGYEFLKEYVWFFYHATKKYCHEFDINYDNWIFYATEISKYDTEKDLSQKIAMKYHTDYEYDKNHEPGIKFGLASILYLNEDYNGGEICFKIMNNDMSSVINSFDYKPNTGDMLVFPSDQPFYHSVKSITHGNKYVIRQWWRYYYSGSKEFIEQKDNFLLCNTEEEWEKYLEKKRSIIREQIDSIVNPV